MYMLIVKFKTVDAFYFALIYYIKRQGKLQRVFIQIILLNRNSL